MAFPQFHGSTCLEAWAAAAEYLRAGRPECLNMMIEIDNPTELQEVWLQTHNPRRFLARGDDIRDVINTIFPYRLVDRSKNRAEIYSKYLAAHRRGRRRVANRGAWGTYFQRLIDFQGDGTVNQLETILDKLTEWQTRSTTGLVFHLSSPHLDRPRTRGGPCWHYGELIWNEGGVIDLVVVYRNHDYFNKALGNFIGLGQLLRFLCGETDKIPGKLICHSIRGYYDVPRSPMEAMLG